MESLVQKLAAHPRRSILLLGLILLLAGNGTLPLTDRDETRFAEASREMIQRADYVVPWFNGQWRFDKPILIYWCQSACYRLLGENAFAARLPSVLFTTATALILVCWVRKYAHARTAFMAGAMFLAGLHVAVIGRVATADMAMVFFFTLAVWSGWELTRPEQFRRWVWWGVFYVTIALGFLAKGPEAWLPLVGLVIGRLWRKDWYRLPVGETVLGVGVAAALTAAWGIPALEQTHGEFFRVGMGVHVFQRSTGVNDGHGLAGIGGFLLTLPVYFLTFFASFYPWSTRVPGNLRRWWTERTTDGLGWYLLVQALIVFAVFSCVRTKLPHYTLPAFPCLALWLAWRMRTDVTAFAWFQKRLVIMTAVVLVVMLGLTPIARQQFLAERLWSALATEVRPETKVGCYGYTESGLVWKFRQVVTNDLLLGEERHVAEFLTNQPPYILVLPTKDLPLIGDAPGRRIPVRGFDMVKFKNWDLTAVVRGP